MKRLLFLVLAGCLMGCGSTRIRSQDPGAEIYMDDRYLGVGEASVRRVGPPNEALLEARRGGKTVGQREMNRSFKGMTIVWGLVSYYTGFYWGWYYPKSVTIPVLVQPDAAQETRSSWSEPGGSIWMQPLNK